MSNELQTFFYDKKEVRTIIKDGEPWWILKDVCDILEIANPSQVADRLDDDERSMFNIGRQGNVNVVNKFGLYNVILRSDKPEAGKFKRWITHEVLPSIDKHGAYITAAKMEEIASDPENLIRLLNSLKTENKQLHLQIEGERAKVLFADAVTTSHCTILVAELAKILKGNGLEIGQNRLFEKLRDGGFLMKRRGADFNSPTQKSMNLKLFSIRETATMHPDGHVTISKTVKVTGKGQVYFVNLFLGKNKYSAPENQLNFSYFL